MSETKQYTAEEAIPFMLQGRVFKDRDGDLTWWNGVSKSFEVCSLAGDDYVATVSLDYEPFTLVEEEPKEEEKPKLPTRDELREKASNVVFGIQTYDFSRKTHSRAIELLLDLVLAARGDNVEQSK